MERAKQVTFSFRLSRSDPNSQLLQRGLIRASWLLYTEPGLGSRGRSAHNAVAVRSSLDCPTPTRDARHYTLCSDLYSPCPFPFPLFPLRWSNYPTLSDSRISLVALHTTHLFFGVSGLRFLRPLCAAFRYQATASQQGAISGKLYHLPFKGFLQGHVEHTFAPVIDFKTVRVVLAVAVKRGRYIHQMDVRTAFLHGDIDDILFISPPDGSKIE